MRDRAVRAPNGQLHAERAARGGAAVGAPGAPPDGDERGGGVPPGRGRRRVRGGRGDGVMGVWAVFKKEMRLYFTSPAAYVLFTFFLLIVGYFFYSIFAFYNLTSMQAAMNPAFARDLNITDAVMRPLFSNTGIILLFFMPMLTMRLLAAG